MCDVETDSVYSQRLHFATLANDLSSSLMSTKSLPTLMQTKYQLRRTRAKEKRTARELQKEKLERVTKLTGSEMERRRKLNSVWLIETISLQVR